jgi:hypothetical protein
VDRALILPPVTRLAPLVDAERAAIVQRSPAFGRYEQAVDRASAYELLSARAASAPAQAAADAPPATRGRREPASQQAQMMDALTRSAARSVGSALGRQLIRGVMGSLLGGGGRRR